MSVDVTESSTPGSSGSPEPAGAGAPRHARRRDRAGTWPWPASYGLAGVVYLAVSVLVWWGVWSTHPTATATCGCGDPSLFMWFIEWPAYALAHGHNPFFTNALFHPMGINLLSNTSVLAIGIPLAPVTWLFGPVASLNVALTLGPVLSALGAFWLARRWVGWAPAAFVCGLLFGFSPYVFGDMAVGHLMTTSLVVLPLWAGTVDELLLRQRRSPVVLGVVLALLGVVEFFVSTEMLVLVLVSTAIAVVLLVAHGLVSSDGRSALARRTRVALPGIVVGAVVLLVLLAYPAWYALAGPAHLSGLVWPNLPATSGFRLRQFIDARTATTPLTRLGGYLGTSLPSPAFVGWGLVAVVVGSLVVWRRDRRLWFFSALALCTAVLSLGYARGHWVPWDAFSHLPVLENVIEQRFVLVMYLMLGLVLAVTLERCRRLRLPAPLGHLAALGVCALALVPLLVSDVPVLPYRTQAVRLPVWFARNGSHLAGTTSTSAATPTSAARRQVLLVYPAPFSGVQSAMTWQAINRMAYDQAGGGGPEGTSPRAGVERPGFDVLTNLAFGFSPVKGTPHELGVVRLALHGWGVTTVVIPAQPHMPRTQEGNDAAFAAAFMTAAIGRRPVVQNDAWVWYGVEQLSPVLRVTPAQLLGCDRPVGTSPSSLRAVSDCAWKASAPRGRRGSQSGSHSSTLSASPSLPPGRRAPRSA